MMSTRRKFLSVFTLGAVGSVVTAAAEKPDECGSPREDGHGGCIALCRSEDVGVGRRDDSPLYFAQKKVTHTVTMSVGRDGHMWLKIDGAWKRIVTA